MINNYYCLPAMHHHRPHISRPGLRGRPHKRQQGKSVFWDAHVGPLSVMKVKHRPLLTAALLWALEAEKKMKSIENGQYPQRVSGDGDVRRSYWPSWRWCSSRWMSSACSRQEFWCSSVWLGSIHSLPDSPGANIDHIFSVWHTRPVGLVISLDHLISKLLPKPI